MEARTGAGHPVWPLVSVIFVDAIGLGLLVPMLPFLVLSMGASPAVVPALVAVYAFAGFLGAPLLGALSDRIDRRLVIVGATAGLSASYVGMALAASLPVLFAFRAFGGLMTGSEVVAQALATDTAPPGRQMQRIGLVGAARGAGMVLGPLLASALAGIFPDPASHFRATLLIAAVLSACACVAAGTLLPAGGRGRRRTGSALSALTASPDGRAILGFYLLTAAISYGFGAIQSVTALYVHVAFRWGAAETGGLLALAAGIILFARLKLAHIVAARLGPPASLGLTFVLAFVTMLLLSLSPAPPVFAPVWALFCLSYGVALVLTTGGVAARAPEAHRGALLGGNQAVFQLALVAGAALNGPLFVNLGRSAPYGVAAAVLLAPALLTCALLILKARPRQPEEALTHVQKP